MTLYQPRYQPEDGSKQSDSPRNKARQYGGELKQCNGISDTC